MPTAHAAAGAAALLAALALSGCAAPQESSGGAAGRPTIVVSSPSFAQGAPIPREHTCDGENASPPLNLYAVPPVARTLVLVMEDPDATSGTFTHWTAWGIPANASVLPRGVDVAALGGREGANDADRQGYAGPCPPEGTHRYLFRVYALRTAPPLEPGSPPDEVRALVERDVLAWGELMGTYTRQGTTTAGADDNDTPLRGQAWD